MEEMDELSSPIKAFLKDCCIVEPGRTVPVDELYGAWCKWCEQQGREHKGTKPSFGRDLGAAIPGLGQSQPRTTFGRVRVYEGVGLEVYP
jgi:putative DNA primase/helicase